MSRVRVAVAGVVAGLLGLTVTGCGVGQTAATAQNQPSAPGINLTDDGVAVRNVTVVFDPAGYQPGDTVPVELVIVNENPEPVRLVEASSEVAGSVAVTGGETTGAAGAALDVPGYGYVQPTLELTGIRTAVDAVSSVPLQLVFDNGVTFEMDVPVAPPRERSGQREPLDFEEDH